MVNLLDWYTHMSLHKVQVKNFQSIKSAEVEFGKFNVFTGPSSSGKSALLRSIEAACRNSFTPDQVRQGAKVAEVTVHIGDHEITAERGRSKSSYTIDDKVYTKTGREVPEEVQKALSLDLISELDVNFSTQFDKPFLIAEPGATASRVLGSLTNVSVIHAASKEVNRRSASKKSVEKVRSQDFAEIVEQLDEYKTLENLTTEYRNADKLLSGWEQSSEELLTLKSTIGACISIKDKVSSLPSVNDSDLRDVDQLVSVAQDLLSTYQNHSTVVSNIEALLEESSHINDIDVPEVDTEGIEEKYKKLDRLRSTVRHVLYLQDLLPSEVPEVPSNLAEDVEDAMSRCRSARLLIEEIKRTKYNIQRTMDQCNYLETSIVQTEEEYDTLLSEQEVCPLCGSSTKHD